MNKKTCFIIGAGEFFGSPQPKDDDLVIAADGGYSAIISHGGRCDLLIGDFDSLSKLPRNVEIIRHPVEKDETDTFLAYFEGARRGYTDFAIYGGTGGSFDHTYANISLLLYAIERGHTARLYGSDGTLRCIKNESIVFSGRVGARVSVFAIGGDARGVSIRGLKYNADGIALSCAFPLGVSNEFVGSEARISVDDGVLLIYIEN